MKASTAGGTVRPPPVSDRENLQINVFQMFKNAYLNGPPWLDEILKYTSLEYLKMI